MAISSERLSGEYLEVNACGIDRINAIDNGSNRPNGRCDYHVLYVESGVCNLLLDGEWQRLPQGSFILFRPHEPQRYFYRKGDNSVSHYIHFSGVGCENLLKKLGIYEIKVFNIGKSASYEKASEDMVYEFGMRKSGYKDFCASLLYMLLCIVSRKYALHRDNVNVKSEKRINAACRKIYDNLKEPPTAANLAEECYLSLSRFLHLFKEVTGRSYTEFVAFIRMEKAKEMLAYTDVSVRDIACTLGYGDQNYFSRHFKMIEGISPTQYRVENK